MKFLIVFLLSFALIAQVPKPGSSGGGGGGGTASFSFSPARTSATVLTLPGISANATAVGSYTCPTAIAAGETITVASGTGKLWIARDANCNLAVRHNIVASCSAGCTAYSSAVGFEVGDFQLSEWTVTAGVLAASANAVATPNRSVPIVAGSNVTVVQANGKITINSSGGVPPFESSVYLIEEFASGTCQVNTTYNFSLGWQLNSNAGGDTVNCATRVAAGRVGVAEIISGAVSGNDASMKLANVIFLPSETLKMIGVFSLSTAASSKATFGFSDDNFNNISSDGCGFEKLAADTNWFVFCMSGGVKSTRVDTTIAADANYRAFQIERVGANYEFRTASTVAGLSSASILTVSTNIPTVACRPVSFIETATAATRSIIWDAFLLQITGLTK